MRAYLRFSLLGGIIAKQIRRLGYSARAHTVLDGDVLLEAGIAIDMKCSEGICGVCAVPIVSGEIEHRDHVLSAKERQRKFILCCSRAKNADGEIVVDMR